MTDISYQLYEMAHAALIPARLAIDSTRIFFKNPFNPLAHTMLGKNITASTELFERVTRRYGKPEFDLPVTNIDGKSVPIRIDTVWHRPFCRLLNFKRLTQNLEYQPKILIIAPLSGHYATLLRGTVETFLPTHDVYITDWTDARLVPKSQGRFDLNDYIDYVIDMIEALGPHVHTIGVCQPAVPLIAAVALMDEDNNPNTPVSMTLIGGPIDTRKSPTAVNTIAHERGTEWFARNCIVTVPYAYPGFGRKVYPGFLQLSGFMAMNLDRHMTAHIDMFQHLVKGDGDSAEKHRDFYDEYLAVMDLTQEFYMQTVETVFVKHLLPDRKLLHRNRRVDLGKIKTCALLTIEGENDDISGVGQTYAAHDLCINLPDHLKHHHLQKDVGHYGVFNGSRFRKFIAPKICDFISLAQTYAEKRSLDKKPTKPLRRNKLA